MGSEPVAWMYATVRTEPQQEVFLACNRANMDPRYWTETPLYTRPPATEPTRPADGLVASERAYGTALASTVGDDPWSCVARDAAAAILRLCDHAAQAAAHIARTEALLEEALEKGVRLGLEAAANRASDAIIDHRMQGNPHSAGDHAAVAFNTIRALDAAAIARSEP